MAVGGDPLLVDAVPALAAVRVDELGERDLELLQQRLDVLRGRAVDADCEMTRRSKLSAFTEISKHAGQLGGERTGEKLFGVVEAREDRRQVGDRLAAVELRLVAARDGDHGVGGRHLVQQVHERLDLDEARDGLAGQEVGSWVLGEELEALAVPVDELLPGEPVLSAVLLLACKRLAMVALPS